MDREGWNNENVFRILYDFILVTSLLGLEKIKNENLTEEMVW